MKISQTLPYYQQETEFTCGPATLRSLLDGLRRIRRYEHFLADEMHTSEKDGTQFSDYISIARSYGLDVVSGEKSGIEPVRKCIEQGFVPLVCFYDSTDNEFHYAIVSEIEGDRIHLFDPWYGPDIVMTLDDFVKIWYSELDIETNKQWYAAFR